MAAIATSNLSFSRGVKFIAASHRPEPWQRVAAERVQHRHQIVPERGTIWRAKPRQCKAVPCRCANLTAELIGFGADRLDMRFVPRRNEHRSQRDIAAGHDRL